MLRKLQEEQVAWVKHNFGDRPAHMPLLGATEEIGELAECEAELTGHIIELVKAIGRLSHSHLKQEQGIRLTENHESNAKDAVADIVIFLSDYCSARGFDFQDIVQGTWDKVRQRDWKKNRDTAHKATT